MCMGCGVTALDITVRKDGLTRIQSLFTVMLRLVAYCMPGRHAAVSRGRDVELFVLRGGSAVYKCQGCRRQYGFKN